MKTFTSTYQLLPTYPVLRTGEQVLRIAETDRLEPQISRARAAAGLAFHDDIRAGVERRDPALSKLSFQGSGLAPEAALRPALRLSLEALYRHGETTRAAVQIVNQAEDPGSIALRLIPADGGAVAIEHTLERDGAGWVADLSALPPGLYSVEVAPERRGPLAPPPIHDLLEVVA